MVWRRNRVGGGSHFSTATLRDQLIRQVDRQLSGLRKSPV